MTSDSRGGSLPQANFSSDEAHARALDATDRIAPYREEFLIPQGPTGKPFVYLCGHSLGLQPLGARAVVEQELHDWATLAVDAHFHGATPWYSYHESLQDASARLVGALPNEVVAMNSLTVNLHLMMVSFYRPTRERYKILMEYPAFPSDTYAVKTHLAHRGYAPAEALSIVTPRESAPTLDDSAIVDHLERFGSQIALVLLGGVNFITGQWFDIPAITAAAHRQGCMIGWDLAHAAGNVPLALHDWDVDFAAWCSYKYLNGGPGAVAGCFVHERHGMNPQWPRLGGWWGNDPRTRFQMHLIDEFVPEQGARGWQVSNPPIFSMAPLRASLALFDRAGMPALRAKSEMLTAYLHYLIDCAGPDRFEIVTPSQPERRGCQLSLKVRRTPRELLAALHAAGVVCDFREPDFIRVAPVPLYNTFHDVWSFAQILWKHSEARR